LRNGFAKAGFVTGHRPRSDPPFLFSGFLSPTLWLIAQTQNEMKTIAVTPKTKEQGNLLLALLREMGTPYTVQEIGTSEEDMYWPALEEKLERARREKAEGHVFRKLPSENMAEFLERTSVYEEV